MKDIKSNGFHDIIVQAIEEMKMVLLMCPTLYRAENPGRPS